MTGATTVTLLPLDDRPVNTSQVATLAEVAGARLLLPPGHLVPPGGEPGDVDGLSAWLEAAAATSDAVVVSVNQLAFGGFVASRRTVEPLATVLARLDVLRRLRATAPDRPIHAFVTLMRTKAFDDAGAEPPYWATHGRRFFALSRELHQAEHGLPSDAEAARAAVPATSAVDFFTRRMRLHSVQLACIELAAAGVIDTLSILVEDSTVESVSTSEREWLEAWIRRLDLADRLRCLSGADEAAAVLVTRAVLARAGRRVAVAVECVDPDALGRVATYEDVPVGQTVAAQIECVGGELVEDLGAADLVLAVHPPGEPPRDWCRWPVVPDRSDDTAATRLAARVRQLLDAGHRVTVADVADANGSDPALVKALREAGVLRQLAGYGGWNTAGNTIGTAVAQGCVHLLAGTSEQRAGHSRSVIHRLLEDWGYQNLARRAIIESGTLPPTEEVTDVLDARLAELGPVGATVRIRPGSVRFPWNRAFEIDFELEARTREDDGR
ncbi:DUF4127 family protein [Jiangella asiatica]|uniref:DUF4127 family protein n=1 Tax=Jiangella asiatica TaxID=2530372 RepID=A0A4R5DTP2_9ACTN|nr:DUF4127 family protein [Jiangella asiatica]TDE14263.1 DUF4127 family protein [Jiangella asiatica]